MRYLIDGYNLIGKLTSIALSDPKKETKCAQFLSQYKQKKDHITLVFDGKSQFNTYPSYQTTAGIRCIFTDNEESADEYIYRKLPKLPQSTIIITSDNAILRASKKQKTPTLSCETFLTQLLQKKENPEEKPETTPVSLDYWLDQFNSQKP